MPSKTPDKKATKAPPKAGGGGKAKALQKPLQPSEELAAAVAATAIHNRCELPTEEEPDGAGGGRAP